MTTLANSLEGGEVERLACRGCGSTMTRSEMDAAGWLNCCPERAMNEVIERDHGVPALVAHSDGETSHV